jgi:hypothetical protein|tara:strand:+ start:5872 stop:7095 length:1224 start_codon:yes stop_codon:yes gene_type:complete
MAGTSRPELLKLRSQRDNDGRRNGKTMGSYLSFPTKPMPHGLLLQFKSYNYKDYVSAITKTTDKAGKTKIEENKNLGFVPSIAGYNLTNEAGSNKPVISSSDAIELPFPRTLQDSTNIRVQQFERDFLYERLASGIASFNDGEGGLSNFFSGVAGATENLLDSTFNAFKSAGQNAGNDGVVQTLFGAIKGAAQKMGNFDTNQAMAMAGYLARNFIPGEIAKSVGVVSQKTVNPQETLSFSGVDLRNFTFSWDLYPSNPSDTQAINKIINRLKMKALPTTQSAAGTATARAFLNYPDIVELNLLGVKEDHFMRFKRCMIQSVTVDYGAGGMPEIIKGGVPAAITLTVTFSEIQIQTAHDYGADPTDTPPANKVDSGAAESSGPQPGAGAQRPADVGGGVVNNDGVVSQ